MHCYKLKFGPSFTGCSSWRSTAVWVISCLCLFQENSTPTKRKQTPVVDATVRLTPRKKLRPDLPESPVPASPRKTTLRLKSQILTDGVRLSPRKTEQPPSTPTRGRPRKDAPRRASKKEDTAPIEQEENIIRKVSSAKRLQKHVMPTVKSCSKVKWMHLIRETTVRHLHVVIQCLYTVFFSLFIVVSAQFLMPSHCPNAVSLNSLSSHHSSVVSSPCSRCVWSLSTCSSVTANRTTQMISPLSCGPVLSSRCQIPQVRDRFLTYVKAAAEIWRRTGGFKWGNYRL